MDTEIAFTALHTPAANAAALYGYTGHETTDLCNGATVYHV